VGEWYANRWCKEQGHSSLTVARERIVSLVYLVYLVCLVEQDKPDELVQVISLSCPAGAVEE